MTVLLVTGDVELGAEAEDADRVQAWLPERIGVVEGALRRTRFGGAIVVDGGREVEAAIGWVGLGGRPQVPAHLELISHVLVELLGGFGYRGLECGVVCTGGGVNFGAVDPGALADVNVDTLVAGRLGEVDGICGCGGDTLSTHQRELAQDSGERARQGFEAEVGVPQAEVKTVGHDGSF